MTKFIKQLYLSNRIFYLLGIVFVLYILAFFFPLLLNGAHLALLVLAVLVAVDISILFRLKGIKSRRIVPEKLSNGDENFIRIDLKNQYSFPVKVVVIDEVPIQFQLRNFEIYKKIHPQSSVFFEYPLIPKQRGEYSFGILNIYTLSTLQLVARRYKFEIGKTIPSFPSFIHLPKYELMAMQNEFMMGGIKKIRRLGHTMEFEQIKEYVTGDDIRSINWKASSKHNRLMVNQYQEEKAQRVYMLIDKGRTMKMPFNGLSLLDYAINASMALSHIVLKKKDKAGVMTFSNNTENVVVADAKFGQLKKIAENLYNVRTNFYESDFGKLYADLRRKISQRSLLLLFSNFETLDALHRQLPYLRGIAKNHLLVVVFFKNEEMYKIMQQKKQSIQEIYDEIIAEKFEFEKKLIRQELLKYGIQSIHTLPENLSISVINKYLEIKARSIL